jgi:DNA (cytosine-5)-methyltransferase 1
MIHIGLFEGLGGFSLAAKEMGWRTLVACEIADFPSAVLKHHFPEAYHHNDVKTLTYDKIDYELTKRFGTRWRAEDIVLTGGFP